MTKRTVIGLIVLLLILSAVVWLVVRRDKRNDQAAAPILAVFAYNQTKNQAATQTSATPNDVIVYTLTAENQSDKVVPGFVMEANIGDVTDKSTLIDASGASYNSGTNSLVWTPLDIPAKGIIQKQFSVRVNSLPAGSSNTVMKIKFNNELEVSLQPTPAQIAGANSNQNFNAPVTGPALDLGLWLAGFATLAFAGLKRYRSIKA